MTSAVKSVCLTITVMVMGMTNGFGQSMPKTNPPADAFKLPDGTIIFYASPANSASPTIDSVRLSAKEYEALLERLNRVNNELKAIPPSECQIEFASVVKGETNVAELTATFHFQTTKSRTLISLGGRGMFPIAVRYSTDEIPILRSGEEGFTVLVERAGEYTLIMKAEANISFRVGRNEVGFEIGLPGAVLTSITRSKSFQEKFVSISARSNAAANDLRRIDSSRLDVTAERPKGYPVGAATSLEVTWNSSDSSPSGIDTAHFDTAVRVEDTIVESVSKIRLKGRKKNWSLALPNGSLVAVERISSKPNLTTDGGAIVTSPKTPAQNDWQISTPETGEWLVTVTHRQNRPAKTAADFNGPFSVGPLTVRDVFRQTGTIRIFAPPAVRIVPHHGSEIQIADPLPAVAGEDAPTASFVVRAIPATPSIMTFEVRQAPSSIQLRPTHRLRLTDTGWRLRSECRIVPIHVEVSQLVLEVPSGWGSVDVGPAETVEGVTTISDGNPSRRLAIRLNAARKEPFDLIIESTFPTDVNLRTHNAIIPLLKLMNVVTRESKIFTSVPDGWDVKGSVQETGAAKGTKNWEMTAENVSGKSAGPVTNLTANCERECSNVTLTWQPYRPELAVNLNTDVVVNDRQIVISQAYTFTAQAPYPKPIRLRGPVNISGLRATPSLTPLSSGEYSLQPPTDKKTFTLTVSYAVPVALKSSENEIPVHLLLPEDATRTNTIVRAWGPYGRNVTFVGKAWREEPLSPSPDRETWPSLTVSNLRVLNEPPASLILNLREGSGTYLPDTVIDRAVMVAMTTPERKNRLISQYGLIRWPIGGLEIESPADTTCEFWLDNRKMESATQRTDSGNQLFRIPMPDSRPGRGSLLLEIRMSADSQQAIVNTFTPPIIRRAAYQSPIRWSVMGPSTHSLLVFGNDPIPKMKWRWGGLLKGIEFSPQDDIEESFIRLSGDWEIDGSSPVSMWEGLTDRANASVRVFGIPRVAVVLICSIASLLLIFAMYQLVPQRRTWLIMIISCAVVVSYFMSPQPTGHMISAAQPGVLIAFCLWAYVILQRWWDSRNRYSLIAFERVGTDSQNRVVVPPSDSKGSRSNSKSNPPIPVTS